MAHEMKKVVWLDRKGSGLNQWRGGPGWCLLLCFILPGCVAPPPDPAVGCRVQGLPGADTTGARGACQYARSRINDLFGLPVPGVEVVIVDSAGIAGDFVKGGVQLRWGARSVTAPANHRLDGMGTGAPSLPAIAVQGHEIGHLVLTAMVGDTGATRTDGYGSRLPDWLDEGVAVWSEPPHLRRHRLAGGQLLPDSAFDLRALLRWRHPSGVHPERNVPFQESRIMVRCHPDCVTAGFTADTTVVVVRRLRDGTMITDTLPSTDIPSLGADLWENYFLSYSLLAYIREQAGAAGAREVMERELEGDRSARVLVTALGARSIDALEQDWRSWVRNLKGAP